MTKAFLFLLSAAPLLAGVTPPAQPDLQSGLDALVNSERAFAKTSEDKGTKEAFLAFLADDSVLFRPGPVPGRSWTEQSPPSKGLLLWHPVKADVARSGDLGYTTGPWDARRAKDQPPVVQGTYVTVWKKQADGAWKVMTDIGVAHPKPAADPAEELRLDPAEVQRRGGAKDDPQAAEAALLAADRDFSKASQAKGALAAYQDALADDARLLRNGTAPALGKEAARGLLADQKGTMTWEPAHALLSQAGDLGVTYGTYDQSSTGPEGKPEQGSYLRIWKKPSGDAWKVILDITSPPPPPPPPAPAAPPH